VLAQVPVARAKVGVTVRVSPASTVFASAPKATLTVPLECAVEVGTAWSWQSPQASGWETPPVLFTCAWWAPTRAPVVAPEESLGGAALTLASAPATAARAASPWQLVQVRVTTSTLPSTWVAATTVEAL
jgi:hypothetical protein